MTSQKACNRINIKIVTVLVNITYIIYKKILLKNVQNAANKYQVLCNFIPPPIQPHNTSC